MDELDLAEIAASLGEGPVQFVEAGTAEAEQVPSRWRNIAHSADPATRRTAALSLWNRDFLDMIPRFKAALHDNLVDVRVCLMRGDWVLVYIARATHNPYIAWIGWDPDTFGDTPPYWDSIPGPLQEFLRNVHAGFTAPDCESYGAVPPTDMTTYAAWAGFDGPIPGWDDESRISSTRLLFVTKNSGLLSYCASPDAPPGKVALVYEGDVDTRQDFDIALDELMSGRFEFE